MRNACRKTKRRFRVVFPSHKSLRHHAGIGARKGEKISLQNKARHHTEFTTKRHLYYSAFGLSEARKQCQLVYLRLRIEYSFECDVLSRLEIFIRFVIGLDRELALLQTDTTTIRTRQQLSRADQNFRLKKIKNKRTWNLSESDLISIGKKRTRHL